MSLPRLRLEKCINEGGIWQIDAEQAHHLINVRRCCNGSLVEGLFEGEKVELKILCKGDSVYAEEISRETEAPLFPELHLMLALLKSEQLMMHCVLQPRPEYVPYTSLIVREASPNTMRKT